MDIRNRVTANGDEVARLPALVQTALTQKVKPALLKDPFWGDKIRRELWPKRLRKMPNLFRFEMPDAHRGVYSVLTHPGYDREIRIVWLGTHKKYDRVFGYHTS